MPSTLIPFTQAFNFFSATQGGVDPRTGLFMFNLPLGEVCGNNTLGPLLPLALRYSPLQVGNLFRLGKGISLGLTTYDRTNRMLALSSGERFKTDDAGGAATPVIRQQKLDIVRLATVGKKIIVTLKSGERQTLSEPGGSGNIYVPESIESPLGYMLKLDWDKESPSKLSAIKNSQGITVCSLTYGVGTIDMTLWPGTAETVSFKLELLNEYLTKITNTSVSRHLVWTLVYDSDTQIQIGGQALLKQIVSPTMLEESVQYKAGIMKFEIEAARGALPAVVQHRLNPMFDQPVQTTTYEYSSKNYLGYEEKFPTFLPDDDNLYNLLTPYGYWSIETQEGDSTHGIPARSIERYYNNYHLLVSETSYEAGNPMTIKREIQYDAEIGNAFNNHTVTFQLPKTVTVTWNDGIQDPRVETTNFEYDLFGNPAKLAAHDGTITIYEYYPANSSTPDCPAEPNGFTQLIRSCTVIPRADDAYKDAPSLKTVWKYEKVDVRKGGTLLWAVLPRQLIRSSADGTKLLSTETLTYTANSDSDEHGRISSRITTVHSNGVDYPSVETFKFSPTQSQLDHGLTKSLLQQVTTTVQAEPGNKKNTKTLSVATSRTQSAFTGRLLAQTDALGNQTVYGYDLWGRLTSRKIHPDKPAYLAEETWIYASPSFDRKRPLQVTHKDIFGNLTRTSYDGLERIIREERKDGDGALGWQTVRTYGYDPLGRNESSTTSDVVHQQGKPLSLTYTTKREWDAWGTLRRQTVQESRLSAHQVTDPIGLTEASWIEGQGTLTTAKRIVFLDPQNRLPTRELTLAYDAHTRAWNPESGPHSISRQQVWDGANQLRKVIDANNNVTQYRYDVYGRVTETTLPDGAIIRKQYAPFSSAPLITQISLQANKTSSPIVLGAQHFDGFGRPIKTTIGRRTSSFLYSSNAERVPSKITRPDGAIESYTTDVRLNEAPTAITALSQSGVVAQSFTYNRQTGQLQSATEAGSCSNHWTAYPSGRLKAEAWDILAGGEQQANYEYSLGGALQQSVSVDRTIQTREYSSAEASIGQMLKLSEPGIATELKYDALQRLLEWKATDGDRNTLTTKRELDSFGRETLRTFVHSTSDTRTVTQEWRPNNLLKRRVLTHNQQTMCIETFDYDGRDRLVSYTASGKQLPIDSYGNEFSAQTFVFDALDNIVECRTTLKTGATIVAKRRYDEEYPCQLVEVNNSPAIHGYPEKIHLRYDAAGRLIRADAGRTLTYDALGRLSSINGSEGKSDYGYDAANRMVWQRVGQKSTLHRLYYQGDELASEWVSKSDQRQDAAKDRVVQPVYAAGSNVAQRETDAGKPSTTLACVDEKNRILCGTTGHRTQEYSYTPYGYCTPIPVDKKS